MGHVRLGTLPKSRSWKEVVGLVADGERVGVIARKTLDASDKAFSHIQNDPGFSEAVWLLTRLAIAAKDLKPGASTGAVGLKLAAQSSVADLASSMHEKLDDYLSVSRQRSDFGELSQGALVGAIADHLSKNLGSLVTPSTGEIQGCLDDLGKPADFGRLSREFFARLARDSTDYFLSKTLGAEVGAGRRFVTTAQVSQFEQALTTHAHEAAKIVEQYSAEWMSKHRFAGDGAITREESDKFGWFALEKVRAEMKARASDAP